MFDARVDQLVYDFNCRPLGYVHTSWLDPAEARFFERLRGSADAQARAAANGALMQRLGLGSSSSDFDFDFAEPAKRLLLLDPAALQRFVFWLGLVGLAHELRTWVERERREVLAQAMGEEHLDFYLRHLLRWPVVQRLAWPTAALRACDATALRGVAERSGTTLLLAAAGAAQMPAVRRGRLKLPRPAGRAHRRAPMTPERAQRIVGFALGCVLREKEPAWHWLF
jgi:hypothetical protein